MRHPLLRHLLRICQHLRSSGWSVPHWVTIQLRHPEREPLKHSRARHLVEGYTRTRLRVTRPTSGWRFRRLLWSAWGSTQASLPTLPRGCRRTGRRHIWHRAPIQQSFCGGGSSRRSFLACPSNQNSKRRQPCPAWTCSTSRGPRPPDLVPPISGNRPEVQQFGRKVRLRSQNSLTRPTVRGTMQASEPPSFTLLTQTLVWFSLLPDTRVPCPRPPAGASFLPQALLLWHTSFKERGSRAWTRGPFHLRI